MYAVESLTDRQRQALRAAYDASQGEGFRLLPWVSVPKAEMFKVLNLRGFVGSAAAGVVTSMRQKADPFAEWTADSFRLSKDAAAAAMQIEVDLEKCKPPLKSAPKASGPKIADIMAEPVQERKRKIVERPIGYGATDLDTIDSEDRAMLAGRDLSYVRGWNRVKRARAALR